MTQKPSLDPEALSRLHKLGGRDLAGKIVAIFLGAAPQKMQEASQGLDQGDLEVVERAVHSMRSSAGNVGALRLSELAEQVEDRAEAGQGDGLGGLLEQMQAEFTQVQEALDKAMKELPS